MHFKDTLIWGKYLCVKTASCFLTSWMQVKLYSLQMRISPANAQMKLLHIHSTGKYCSQLYMSLLVLYPDPPSTLWGESGNETMSLHMHCMYSVGQLLCIIMNTLIASLRMDAYCYIGNANMHCLLLQTFILWPLEWVWIQVQVKVAVQ